MGLGISRLQTTIHQIQMTISIFVIGTFVEQQLNFI